MSKKWYPVINYENCTECGACVEKCTHGVYEPGRSSPRVVAPDNCIEGCTGCQSICPSCAIDYVGDTGKSGGAGCAGCCCK